MLTFDEKYFFVLVASDKCVNQARMPRTVENCSRFDESVRDFDVICPRLSMKSAIFQLEDVNSGSEVPTFQNSE